jgi:hypothetical protein
MTVRRLEDEVRRNVVMEAKQESNHEKKGDDGCGNDIHSWKIIGPPVLCWRGNH